MQRAGFVLVGGQSSRMGRNKALLPWNGRTLVQEIASSVAEAAGSVALVGPSEPYNDLNLEVIPDQQAGFGPISGIHAALRSDRGDYNLIVSCDMPRTDPKVFRLLLESAEKEAAQCTAAVDEAGSIHPLCAVYHKSAIRTVEDAINCRRARLMELLEDLHARPVHVKGAILNCNTPTEWAALQH